MCLLLCYVPSHNNFQVIYFNLLTDIWFLVMGLKLLIKSLLPYPGINNWTNISKNLLSAFHPCHVVWNYSYSLFLVDQPNGTELVSTLRRPAKEIAKRNLWTKSLGICRKEDCPKTTWTAEPTIAVYVFNYIEICILGIAIRGILCYRYSNTPVWSM